MSFTLTLTQQQVEVVAAGLGKLPFETAAPVVSAIQTQLRAAQMKAQADAALNEADAAEVEEAPAKAPKK